MIPRLASLFFYALVIVTGLQFTVEARADWDDILDFFTGDGGSDLTDSEVIRGLKEALANGTSKAINQLGKEDGYLHNRKVKIPVPEKLEKAEDLLRNLKQDKLVDDFITSMNRAAEQAVPEATHIFSDALRQMTFADAREILNGPDDAATRYFRRTSSEQLIDKMLPVVSESTNRVGVTAKYKNLIDKLGFAASLVEPESLDLDRYVTRKAVDGLFTVIAEEERLIRRDPAARTTELLRKVFSQ